MDPNETLRQIRLALVEYEFFDTATAAHEREDMLEDLVMHVKAIDEWLSAGGFLPKPWQAES